MATKDEPGVLALLLAFAAALYAITWLIAGPPGSRDIPVTVPAPPVSITLSAR